MERTRDSRMLSLPMSWEVENEMRVELTESEVLGVLHALHYYRVHVAKPGEWPQAMASAAKKLGGEAQAVSATLARKGA